MPFRVQIVGDAEGGVLRELAAAHDDRTTAERVAEAVLRFLHENREPGAGYGVQVVDDQGRWVWRRPFSFDGQIAAAERSH